MPLRPFAWLAVPLVGVIELVGHLYFERRAPELDEWHAVRPLVESMRTQDELVVVAPAWAEPNARHAFGDELMPLAHVARADESAFSRAIGVYTLGETAPELEGWKVLDEKRDGKFVVRLLENPAPARVLHDFVDALPNATVSDVRGERVEACPWETKARKTAGGLHGHPAYPEQRHQCSGGEYHFAGVTVIEDDAWRGRRCIWAHPIDEKTLTIAYDDVPLGGVIRGYGGIPWWIEREKKRPPVVMEVSIDGRSIGRYTHEDGDGWKRFELPTGAAGRRARVEFRVKSERSKERQFCFVADTR